MSAATNSPVASEDLLRAISGRQHEIAELTAKLISAPSENPPGDERGAVAVVRSTLATLAGIDVTIIEPAPRRESLIASAGPRGTRTLLLGAHLDTVPAGAQWSRDPFGGATEDGVLYGRGASDNKGAAAAMTIAFATLVAAGVTAERRIVLVTNADEEMGGGFGIDSVGDALEEPIDGALIGEPSGVREPFESLYVAARGALRVSVTTGGTGGHSSLTREPTSVNAAEELLPILATLRDRLPALRREHPRYGPATDLIVVALAAGSGWGVVPSAARADIELRVPPGTDREVLESELRLALEGTDAELVPAPGSMGWVAPSEIPENDLLVRSAVSAWRTVLGREPRLGCFPAGTDAGSLAEHGIPTIPAIGPGTLLRAHRPDEFVAVSELATAAKLYALTALRFLFDDDPGERNGHDAA